MKAFRRMLCLALVAMMLCAAALPAYAATTKTVYMSGKDYTSSWFWLDLGEFKKGTKVTDVKSSNTSVLEVTRLSVRNYNYTNYENKKYSNSYVDAEVSGYAKKAGSAKINYKVNGKAKSQTVAIKAYTNPVKNFQLTGISTANLKSQYANSDYAYRDVLTKDAKAGLLKVSAASGWKIECVEFYDRSSGNEVGYHFYAWNKPVSSVSLNVPAIKANKEYSVYVNFVNTKTKGEISISYWI